MKTIRSLMTVVGLSLLVLALGATGAKAQQGQSLVATEFGGTFTLPLDAQWGSVTLPAGDYKLYYGRLTDWGVNMVELVGEAKGSPHRVILAQQPVPSSAKKDAMVCIRDGNLLIVRALELPAIGGTVKFALPHAAGLAAHQRDGNTNTQLAEAHMLIQRVPIKLNGK